MSNVLNHPVLASEIASWSNTIWRGDDCVINKITPVTLPEEGALCFTNKKPNEKLPDGVALIGTEDVLTMTSCLLQTHSPRLTFAKILAELNVRVGFKKSESSPSIHPTSQVSPQAVISPGVKIGARTVIMPFVYVGEGTQIGSDCVIKSGTIIAQDGFGFERDENEIPIRITHLGNVVIGNYVEIGSLNTVCRGTLSDTIIEDHVKTDDHVHIAHNVQVGFGSLLTACVEISGGVVIGRNVWIGPNTSIIQKITIDNNAFIGIGSNVTRNIPGGVVAAGNPAQILRKIQ